MQAYDLSEKGVACILSHLHASDSTIPPQGIVCYECALGHQLLCCGAGPGHEHLHKGRARLLQPAADSPSSAQGHGMGEGVALQMLLYRSLYRLLSWQSKQEGHSNVI